MPFDNTNYPITQIGQIRALLDEGRGWTQGAYHRRENDGRHTYCLVGAVHSIMHNRQDNGPLFDLINDAIGIEYTGKLWWRQKVVQDVNRIVVWNDRHATTWADVDAVLRKAERLEVKNAVR